jgi:hypothetical protein
VFKTKECISEVYNQLLAKHEEPLKAISNSVTAISLSTIEGSLADFRGLTQTTEISTPGRPKRFVAIGISITAMAMLTFNTVWITQ